VLVTNHDSLAYFADRYDFTVLGSILPSTSTLTEASPGQLEELGRAIQAEGVPAIFAESVSSTADADALADRLGVDVVVLYTESLGEPGSGAETYADLMRFDATAIANALR
jgi:zinc/manganese transport system substrate-binding protein